MPSSTLLHFTLGTLLLGLAPSCGSSDSSVLLTLSGLPPRATAVSVSATLDGKPLTGSSDKMLPLALPLEQNQLGLTAPMPGHLALNLQALDNDQCTQGSVSSELDVTPGVTNLTAQIALQSPRKCGTLAPCAQGAACAITGLPTSNLIFSTWAVAPNDIWAVGALGLVMHYDGNTWTTTPTANLPAPGTTKLTGVWASASNDVWAVGSSGRIIHYDGTTWSLSPSGATRNLQGISGVSGQNVWAVGLAASTTTKGEFWHYNGTKWDPIVPLGNGDLLTVFAVNANTVVVGGDVSASGILWIWDGVSSFKDYSASAPVSVYGIWGSSPSRIVAVGAAAEILLFNGTSWKLIANSSSNDLYGVTGDSTSTYLFGLGGFAKRSSDPALGTLTSITGISMATDVYAATLASNGLVWVGGDRGVLSYVDSRP